MKKWIIFSAVLAIGSTVSWDQRNSKPLDTVVEILKEEVNTLMNNYRVSNEPKADASNLLRKVLFVRNMPEFWNLLSDSLKQWKKLQVEDKFSFAAAAHDYGDFHFRDSVFMRDFFANNSNATEAVDTLNSAVMEYSWTDVDLLRANGRFWKIFENWVNTINKETPELIHDFIEARKSLFVAFTGGIDYVGNYRKMMKLREKMEQMVDIGECMVEYSKIYQYITVDTAAALCQHDLKISDSNQI